MDSAVPNNRSWWSLSSGFGDQPVDDKLDTLSSPSEHTLVDDKNIERFGKTEVIDHDLHLLALGVEVGPDGFIQWASGSNDHPRNWSRSRKTFDTTVIILFEFYTTVISTTGAAIGDVAGPEYGLDRRWSLIGFTFMYQLGQAIGGCLIPPLSELVGRRIPYLVSCAVFSLFCILIACAPSPVAAYIGRFVTGFASAVPSVVIAGSVEDLFNTRHRVWILVLWNAGTTIGLCLGPIYAAYITAFAGWRWVFYSASIITAALFVSLLGVKESRPSLLMGRKLQLLRTKTGISDWKWHNPDSFPDMKKMVQLVAIRPMHILFTEPLVIMVAVLSATSWGLIYLFTEFLTPVYVSIGFTRTQATLSFLGVAVGVLFTFLPRIWDEKVVRGRERRHEPIEPEDKIMGFAFAAPALAIGLAFFAWTIPPFAANVHWVVPTLALVPIGFAVNEIAYTMSGYLADSYLLYSASAFSGLAFVRAIVSGLMPLIAHEMQDGLDANMAATILTGISVVFCAAPWIFFRFSKKLRQKSPFACFSLDTHRKTQLDNN